MADNFTGSDLSSLVLLARMSAETKSWMLKNWKSEYEQVVAKLETEYARELAVALLNGEKGNTPDMERDLGTVRRYAGVEENVEES